MKSRKSTLRVITPVITGIGGQIKLSAFGDIHITANDCRCIIFTRGPRRSPSSVQVFSTVHCPEQERVTRSFKFAKIVAKTLEMPVNFSAAGREISGQVKA